MGVSTTTNRFTYDGDGSTETFAFSDYFFNQTDLNVYRYDTLAGGVTTCVLNTDYTISGTANAQGLYPSGANVMFGTAPLDTDIVVIVRNPPETQTYTLLQNGNISSTALVQQLDYMTLLIQRLQDQVNRCPILPDGMGDTFSNQLPSTAPLNSQYYLTVNSDGNGWALVPGLSPVQNEVVSYTEFTGQGGQSYNYPIFEVPEGNLLTYVVVKHTTPFQGSGITTATASVGISGAYTQFINDFNVYQAAGPTVYQSVVANFIGSFSSSTQIYLTLEVGAGDLSALSQGSLIVYYNFDSL